MNTIVRRMIWTAVVLGALYFSLQAGEFSTTDLFHQRTKERRLHAEVDSLKRLMDSLSAVERQVRTDTVTQERIAREEFGMVRGGNEILYKFAPKENK